MHPGGIPRWSRPVGGVVLARSFWHSRRWRSRRARGFLRAIAQHVRSGHRSRRCRMRSMPCAPAGVASAPSSLRRATTCKRLLTASRKTGRQCQLHVGRASVAGSNPGAGQGADRCARGGHNGAASFGTGGVDLSWRDGEPESSLRRAEISGNVVRAPSRFGKEAARFGIEVGHFANQLLIDGNEITSPDLGNSDFRKDVTFAVYVEYDRSAVAIGVARDSTLHHVDKRPLPFGQPNSPQAF